MDARAQILELAAKVEHRTPSCIDFRDHPDFPGCCSSCHDDHDEFNYSLCSCRIPVGAGEVEADVCCKVLTWLDAELHPKP